MIRTTALALATVLASSPALATGEIYCEGIDGTDAVFGIGFGRVPGLAILSATIGVRGQVWSMSGGEGQTPMVVAQGMFDGDRTLIDFADPNLEAIIASVRLQSASEGDDYVMVGTMRIAGIGAFALICEGP